MKSKRIVRIDSNRKPKPVRIPRQMRSMDKRARIIEVAFKLFDTHGYDAVSMRMIARTAGVSLGTPYSYFADKKAVFKEVLVLYAKELKKAFSDEIEKILSKGKELEELIYTLILLLKRLMERHRFLQKDLIILSLVDDEIRRLFAHGELASAGEIIDLVLERLGNQLVIRDRQITKFLIHKGIDQIIEYLIFYEVPLDEKRIFRELARMVSGYLKTSSEG